VTHDNFIDDVSELMHSTPLDGSFFFMMDDMSELMHSKPLERVLTQEPAYWSLALQ
jgi:hypothetical protein